MHLRWSEHPTPGLRLPQDIQKLLASEFPGMRHVKTSSLHRGVSGARHSFLPVPHDANKLDVLSQAGFLLSANIIITQSRTKNSYMSCISLGFNKVPRRSSWA